jgi:hypothetical protein
MAMDSRAKEIVRIGNSLFDKKRTLASLWQEIALQFYPERADFTGERSEGEEFASHMFASYPAMARRELGNLLAANLRPRSEKWFSIHVEDEDLDEGDEERAYLERLTDIQWRAMYDRPAGFVRATKEADHDFATFGNAVVKYGTNVAGDALLYRNYHLRDNAWSENAEGRIDCNHRNWNPTSRQLKHYFPTAISDEVRKACEKDPEKKFLCRHVVMPSRLYDYTSKGGKQFPFVSLYVEVASETILEEVGLNYFPYVIPRWQTISGSAYGVSMATSILLPDGRTIQTLTRTLLEAGEKYVDPPMIAVSDAIRGDIALYAGGVTTADIEYDERLGEVLRPITRDRGGMPIGFEIATALKNDIRAGFFLDKIQMNPNTGKQMTLGEFRSHLQEQIRQTSPIFEPVMEDYSDPLCDGTFNVLRDNGAFPLEGMPESLAGKDIKFKFRSPLTDLADQSEVSIYGDVLTRILMPAAQVDPAQLAQINLDEATRDAMRAGGWKAKWFAPKEAITQRREMDAQKAQEQALMQQIGAAGQIAEQGGRGIQSVRQALAPDQPQNDQAQP